MRTKYILSAFILILALQSVCAIGITPGRTTINFEPNLQKEVFFSVTNSEQKEMSVIFYIKGELKEAVLLSQDRAGFLSGESSKFFSYVVSLPGQFDRPGLHTAEIVAQEVPEGAEEEGTILGSTIAVVTQLYVYVPYPGKYLEFDVEVIEASPGQSTIFLIPMISRGNLGIKKVKTKIEIYSGETFIDEFELEETGVLAGERKELIGTWDTDVDVGRYNARIILNYDGEEKIIKKEFNIGEAKLEIELITVKNFQLGEIAKFNILVNNKMNQEVKDINVNMVLYGEERNVIADFRSANYDAPSLSKIEMVAYWDTEGIDKGVYDGKLILRYGSEKDEKNVKVEVTEDSIEVTGITGKVIVQKDGGFNLTTILVILIVILILGNILWFLVVKRLKRKKQ
ncbi:hypothetical protein KAT80_02465 [Candidatus Pacearchaeota archaeon]|nr:hypothetical protein [Candidatus Pacearchaeota archaeon]